MNHLLVYLLSKPNLLTNMIRDARGQTTFEWRGHNETNPNFKPPFAEPKPPMSKIITPTQEEIDQSTPIDRLMGRAVHSIYSALAKKPREHIVGLAPGREAWGLREHLAELRDDLIENTIQSALRKLSNEEREDIQEEEMTGLKRTLEVIWDYETAQLLASVLYQIAHYHDVSADTIRNRCMPFEPELQIDGTQISLSKNLQADLITSRGENIVIELKTGPVSNRNRLITTGYALALESQERGDVNVGCVMYISVPDGWQVPKITLDFHAITDGLRSRFLEARDDAIRNAQEA